MADLGIQRPQWGAPCNGCGLCCKAELCEPAMMLLGEDVKAPCPMLLDDGKRYWCGMVLIEEKNPEARVNPLVSISLGIGMGCHAIFSESEEGLLRYP